MKIQELGTIDEEGVPVTSIFACMSAAFRFFCLLAQWEYSLQIRRKIKDHY